MTTQISMQTLVAIDCPACGLMFGITDDYERRRRDDHREFKCPAGHVQYFPQKSELESARADAKRLKADLEWERMRVENWKRSCAAQKGQVTRIRNMIAKGICPVQGCRRNFDNVREHMANEHPDYHRHDEADAGEISGDGR